MQKASIPQDEFLRLSDLISHQILDTAEEESYTELLEIAAHICGCPTALISFVDKDRQWFKSKMNLTDTELPRDTSFCGHAINQQELFLIEDASNDERFYDNPNVTGDLNIRFYAGAQIVSSSGFNLGTVCVIDHHPKTITEEQKETLKKIASQVSKMVELKKQQVQMRQLAGSISDKGLQDEMNFDTLFMQSQSPKIIFDSTDYNILEANDAALRLYGYDRSDFLGLSGLDIRQNKSKEFMLKRIEKIEGSQFPVNLRSKHIRKDGKPVLVVINFSVIFYKGVPARLADISDVTDKKYLEEKIKDDKLIAEKRLLSVALKAQQREKDNITDALRENVNQILACSNLYLGIAKADESMRMELIDKSRKNIQVAIAEIKKLYQSASNGQAELYLKDSVGQLILKYELLHSFNIHFIMEGDETMVPEEIRLFLYRIVEEYFTGASKAASVKNVWLTIKCFGQIELIIKNENNKPVNKTRLSYMQDLNKKLQPFNGSAELFVSSDVSCTLQVIIPPSEELALKTVLLEEEFMN